MAEFCLACFNTIHYTDYKEDEVILEEEYCEGCGSWKLCVATVQSALRPNYETLCHTLLRSQIKAMEELEKAWQAVEAMLRAETEAREEPAPPGE